MKYYRYTKCYGNNLYIKETKKRWWNRWKIVREGPFPVLYKRCSAGYFCRHISEQFNPNSLIYDKEGTGIR